MDNLVRAMQANSKLFDEFSQDKLFDNDYN